MIEKGRHYKIPREDRICPNCSLKEIEDEMHFLLCCPCHNLSRINLLSTIWHTIKPGLAPLAWPGPKVGLASILASILASTQILAWPQKLAWPQIWPLKFFLASFFFRIVIYWLWFNWNIISILHLYITIFVFVLIASM